MPRPSKRTAAEAELETPEVRGIRADMTLGRIFETMPETWTALCTETVIDVSTVNVLEMHSHTLLPTAKDDGAFIRFTLGDPKAKPRELTGLSIDMVYYETFERLKGAVMARCSANEEWVWAAVVPIEKGYRVHFYAMQPQEDGSIAEVEVPFEFAHDGIVTDMAVCNSMVTLVLDHNDVVFYPTHPEIKMSSYFAIESGTPLPVHENCDMATVSIVTESEMRVWTLDKPDNYTRFRVERCVLSDVEDMIEKMDDMGLAKAAEPKMVVEKPAMKINAVYTTREELVQGDLTMGQTAPGHYSYYKNESMAVTFKDSVVVFGPQDQKSPPQFLEITNDIIACLSLPGITAFVDNMGSFYVCTGPGGMLEIKLAPPKDTPWTQALISYVDPSCFLCHFAGADGIHVVQHTDYAK